MNSTEREARHLAEQMVVYAGLNHTVGRSHYIEKWAADILAFALQSRAPEWRPFAGVVMYGPNTVSGSPEHPTEFTPPNGFTSDAGRVALWFQTYAEAMAFAAWLQSLLPPPPAPSGPGEKKE